MIYNTKRDNLMMPEYGRGVQKMVEYAVSLPTKKDRQQCAEFIIEVMARQQNEPVGSSDLTHRLWNHLARISHYQLEVDYPVPIIVEDDTTPHVRSLSYPMKKIKNRHYGYLLEACLLHLCEMPKGEAREAYLEAVANQMKQSLFVWNPESMDEELVATDIARYTNGQVQLDLGNFRFASVAVLPGQQGGKKKK